VLFAPRPPGSSARADLPWRARRLLRLRPRALAQDPAGPPSSRSRCEAPGILQAAEGGESRGYPPARTAVAIMGTCWSSPVVRERRRLGRVADYWTRVGPIRRHGAFCRCRPPSAYRKDYEGRLCAPRPRSGAVFCPPVLWQSSVRCKFCPSSCVGPSFQQPRPRSDRVPRLRQEILCPGGKLPVIFDVAPPPVMWAQLALPSV